MWHTRNALLKCYSAHHVCALLNTQTMHSMRYITLHTHIVISPSPFLFQSQHYDVALCDEAIFLNAKNRAGTTNSTTRAVGSCFSGQAERMLILLPSQGASCQYTHRRRTFDLKRPHQCAQHTHTHIFIIEMEVTRSSELACLSHHQSLRERIQENSISSCMVPTTVDTLAVSIAYEKYSTENVYMIYLWRVHMLMFVGIYIGTCVYIDS